MKIYKMSEVDPQVIDKVSTAKISLSTKPEFTFFTTALLRLNLMYGEVGTLCTNGINLTVDPAFVKDMSNRQIAFCLMHEVMHVVYNHITRLGNKDHKLWNTATDYVINNQLDDMGMDVIDGICLNHQFDGWTADQVYAHLTQNPPDDKDPRQQPNFNDMVEIPEGTLDSNGNPIPTMDPAALTQAVEDLVNQSVMAAQQAGGNAVGNIPGELLRAYDDRMAPKIDWKDALRDFMFAAGKQGSSFKKPSRRGLSQGLTLPGRLGHGLGRIDFSIDTSGSVSEEMFQQFISEIAFIFDRMKPKQIGISQFDHELKSRDVITNPAHFKQIKFVGGGGTDINPVLDMYKKVDSKALIVLTDGYFHRNRDMDPGKPVVWCIYNNPTWQPPFGKAIHFKL